MATFTTSRTGTLLRLRQCRQAASSILRQRSQLQHYAKAQRPHQAQRLVCRAGLATAVAAPTIQTASPTGSSRSLSSVDLLEETTPLAFEMVQGPLVRWCHVSERNPPPTAVLVHGILGSRRNLQSFAKMIVEACPAWQVLLVDLRCHGETAALPTPPSGPHTVEASASDILTLLRRLRLFPRVLIGHSYGGKVVMSMTQQFGQTLPRPVQVWVLDSLPGPAVRAGEADGLDHPERLIEILRSMPLPIRTRNQVVDELMVSGFSTAIARWAATNLRPARGNPSELYWSFDLDGIAQMYRSYEDTSMYPLLERPPQGLKVDFVRAEQSTFRWGGGDQELITHLGHRVHLLPQAGHWVHTDNPHGLLSILQPSFTSLGHMST